MGNVASGERILAGAKTDHYDYHIVLQMIGLKNVPSADIASESDPFVTMSIIRKQQGNKYVLCSNISRTGHRNDTKNPIYNTFHDLYFTTKPNTHTDKSEDQNKNTTASGEKWNVSKPHNSTLPTSPTSPSSNTVRNNDNVLVIPSSSTSTNTSKPQPLASPPSPILPNSSMSQNSDIDFDFDSLDALEDFEDFDISDIHDIPETPDALNAPDADTSDNLDIPDASNTSDTFNNSDTLDAPETIAENPRMQAIIKDHENISDIDQNSILSPEKYRRCTVIRMPRDANKKVDTDKKVFQEKIYNRLAPVPDNIASLDMDGYDFNLNEFDGESFFDSFDIRDQNSESSEIRQDNFDICIDKEEMILDENNDSTSCRSNSYSANTTPNTPRNQQISHTPKKDINTGTNMGSTPTSHSSTFAAYSPSLANATSTTSTSALSTPMYSSSAKPIGDRNMEKLSISPAVPVSPETVSACRIPSSSPSIVSITSSSNSVSMIESSMDPMTATTTTTTAATTPNELPIEPSSPEYDAFFDQTSSQDDLDLLSDDDYLYMRIYDLDKFSSQLLGTVIIPLKLFILDKGEKSVPVTLTPKLERKFKKTLKQQTLHQQDVFSVQFRCVKFPLEPPALRRQFFLIRHGQSKWNHAQESRQLGKMLAFDHGLTQAGANQALHLNFTWRKMLNTIERANKMDKLPPATPTTATAAAAATTTTTTNTTKTQTNRMRLHNNLKTGLNGGAGVGVGSTRSLQLNTLSALSSLNESVRGYYESFSKIDAIFSSPLTRAIQTAILAMYNHKSFVANGLFLSSVIREVKNVGGLDTVGKVCDDEIRLRVLEETRPIVKSTSILEKIEAMEYDYGDAIRPWWTPASTYDRDYDVEERIDTFLNLVRYWPCRIPIFVGHSLFFKAFYSKRLHDDFVAKEPVLSRNLRNHRLSNASLLYVEVEYSDSLAQKPSARAETITKAQQYLDREEERRKESHQQSQTQAQAQAQAQAQSQPQSQPQSQSTSYLNTTSETNDATTTQLTQVTQDSDEDNESLVAYNYRKIIQQEIIQLEEERKYREAGPFSGTTQYPSSRMKHSPAVKVGLKDVRGSFKPRIIDAYVMSGGFQTKH